MKRPVDPFEGYLGIVRGLADSIREMTDDEVLAELRADGGDPALSAGEARQELLEQLRRTFVDRSPFS